MTLRTLQTIAHSILMRARVSDEYIHFALMYPTDHIFPVLPIKNLVNKDGEPTTPHQLATGNKPSVINVHVLYCQCVVLKATSHVDTKSLGMCHNSKKSFRVIFIGIPQHIK